MNRPGDTVIFDGTVEVIGHQNAVSLWFVQSIVKYVPESAFINVSAMQRTILQHESELAKLSETASRLESHLRRWQSF